MITNKKFIVSVVSFFSLCSFFISSNFCVAQQPAPTIINYTYDPSGQRIKVSNSTTTTMYPTKNYNVEFNTQNLPPKVTKHIFAGGQNLATIEGTGATATIYYNTTDVLNSSSVMTDSAGAIAETMDYFPFGSIRLDKKASTSTFNEQRKYIGQEYDTDTGLNYLNARYYNATLARFISQDPAFWNNSHIKEQLVDPQTWNSYSYARNNPIVYLDQQGEFAFFIPILIYATPSIITAGVFIATQPALVGMIGNAFMNRPVETSTRATPIVGDVIDAKEAISGKDAFSGNSLLWSDRALSGLSAALPFVAGGVVRKTSEMASIERSALPKHAQEILSHLENNGFKNPMQGYKGGRVFVNKNLDLPQQDKGYYKEWDTSPKQSDVKRTYERIVTGKGGEMYYTNTHYGDPKIQGPAFLKVNK